MKLCSNTNINGTVHRLRRRTSRRTPFTRPRGDGDAACRVLRCGTIRHFDRRVNLHSLVICLEMFSCILFSTHLGTRHYATRRDASRRSLIEDVTCRDTKSKYTLLKDSLTLGASFPPKTNTYRYTYSEARIPCNS